jgi:cell division septal protein FtsQ
VYCGYRASIVAAHAHVLQVERILVRGNDRLSKGEVLAVLTGLSGESLVWPDLDAWRRRLLAFPGCVMPRGGDRCRQRWKS